MSLLRCLQHRRTRIAVAVLTSLVTPACALLVGDLDGHATLGSDAGAAADTGKRDASLDVASDGTLDAKSDVNRDDAHGAGAHDARAEATKDAADDRAIDAGHDAPRDVAVVDAGQDASPKPFCATIVAVPGELVMCDDFDDEPDAAALGSISRSATATFVAEQDASLSPPNGLVISVPLTASGSSGIAYLSRSFTAASSVTLDFDVRFDVSIGTPATNYTSGFTFGTVGGVTSSLILTLSPADGGASENVLLEETYGTDGGAGKVNSGYRFHTAAPLPSGWMHVSIRLFTPQGSSTLADSFNLNDAAVETEHLLEPSLTISAGATALIGYFYALGSTPHQQIVDNVVLRVFY